MFGPEDEGLTRPWAHFATRRGRVPAWVKQVVLKAVHRPILAQDRRILALQAECRGGSPYETGPLDIMGPTIWRLANRLIEPEQERALNMEL